MYSLWGKLFWHVSPITANAPYITFRVPFSVIILKPLNSENTHLDETLLQVQYILNFSQRTNCFQIFNHAISTWFHLFPKAHRFDHYPCTLNHHPTHQGCKIISYWDTYDIYKFIIYTFECQTNDKEISA